MTKTFDRIVNTARLACSRCKQKPRVIWFSWDLSFCGDCMKKWSEENR